MTAHRLLCFALATLLMAPAAAQTVYRCGNDYGQVACEGGRAVETQDEVTPQRRRDAARVARSERSQGDAMARERLSQQADQRPAAAASLGPAKASPPADKASASIKPKKKARGKIRVVEGDDFVAREPQSPKSRKKKDDPR